MSLRKRKRVGCRFFVEPLESRWLLASTQFAVIGDFGVDNQAELDVSNLVKSWNPEYVLTVGDNNYQTGSAAEIDKNIGKYYHDFIYPYTGGFGSGPADNQNHFFPSLGNHDWGNISNNPTGANPYLNYFTLPGNERYYDFVRGPVHFFAIDSDQNEPDGTNFNSVQGQWLQQKLAASTEQWNVVYFHHPAYVSSSRGNNTYMQWPFKQWGADVVLSGHEHVYERLNVDGLPYVINGLGGASIGGFVTPIAGSQVRYNADYGAMKVGASDTAITFQFYTRTNALIDTFSINTSITEPMAPADLSASPLSASRVDLKWTDHSVDESTFDIERSIDGTNFSPLVSVGADVTTYSDQSVSPGTKYYYRVRATNNSGSSAYAGPVLAKTYQSTTFIPAGSTWKYLDNGSDQGTAWRATGFSEVGWSSGAAKLGYGDPNEVTTISYGPNPSSKYITTYFRKSFNVADATAVNSLDLQLLRDDGAVVYLNGQEIFRSNLPAGTITSSTSALTPVDGANEDLFYTATANASLLVNGTNVIAVEVHQSSGASSDLGFNFSLVGSVIPATLVARNSTWKFKDDGSNQGTAWRASGFDDVGWSGGAAELGYGDGDEATVVNYGPDPNNKFTTTYFRRAFNVIDPARFASLALSLLRDDGAIVYLNGTEIFRSNMPGGAVTSSTLASSAIADADENVWVSAAIDPMLLVAGNNVLAVEIHQANADSSDISFNAQLTATYRPTRIEGEFFRDTNSNGIGEPTESGLQDWTVYLDTNNDNIKDVGEPSLLSNGEGEFSFEDLPAGTYYIKQIFQSGFRKTLPGPGIQGYTVNLAEGEHVDEIEFGNTTNILLGGTIYNDLNGNGIKDAGENAIAGVTINIISNNVIITSRVSDANGKWRVQGLAAGTGSAEIVIPAGYTATFPVGGKIEGSMTAGQQNANLNFGVRLVPPIPVPRFSSTSILRGADSDSLIDNLV